MATAQKISELTTAGPLTGAELVPVVQNSGTLQTTVSVLKAYAVVSIEPEISALNTRIDQVSALVSSEAVVVASLAADVSGALVAVASLSAAVSSLAVRVDNVSAVATSIGAVVSTFDTRISDVSAAVVSVNAVISTLEVRVSTLSAAVSANAAAITSVNNTVSALEIRVSNASAAIVSTNAVVANVSALVSALDIRVTNVSASVSVLNSQMVQVQASISAINSVLATIDTSAIAGLEVRVSNLSIAVSTNTAAITSINAVVSTLDIRLAAVSASVSVNAAAITSINAVLSTKVNRVGDYMDNVQYIEFDTSTITATSVGRLVWDTEYGTLDIGLAGGNSNVLIGQREVAYIYNNTSATIQKGKVVEVTGAQGQRLTVKLAQGDNDVNSATILGIMLETVSVNNSGYVATNGIVRNVDTGAFTDGQIVYLSPVSAGELTATKPVAPQHLVLVGYVVKGGSVGAGSIFVHTQNGFEIGELHDVKTSSSASIANNEVIAWNTSAGVFTNSTVLIETQASISVLQLQVDAVSAATSVNDAAITSINNVVSALEIRVSSASATGVTNTAAITSINDVVSALEIRVSTVSAQASAIQSQVNAVSVLVSALDVRVAAVSASVSALQVQVNNVSSAVSAVLVSVGQRVLKAGDTMTGTLNINTSADAQAVSVAGYATFSSRVSISAGFYTGLQNLQDNTVQRPSFQDYALILVAKGSVSATATLDLLEGNYFEARAAGSTTFVFANPPVSATGNGRTAGGFILELQNGGAATVTWPSATKWPGGTAPTLTSSGFDVLVFITDDGGTTWRGVQSMKDSK